MPSAARPFSRRLVADLTRRGIRLARVTLHTGVSSLEAHEPPAPERFSVGEATAHAINEAKRNGGRVIARRHLGRASTRECWYAGWGKSCTRLGGSRAGSRSTGAGRQWTHYRLAPTGGLPLRSARSGGRPVARRNHVQSGTRCGFPLARIRRLCAHVPLSNELG